MAYLKAEYAEDFEDEKWDDEEQDEDVPYDFDEEEQAAL